MSSSEEEDGYYDYELNIIETHEFYNGKSHITEKHVLT